MIPAISKLLPIFLITTASVFCFWFFVSAAQELTGGVWTAPLDDTFIHFQYAKQIAHGHWFKYYPDAPISTGATSFLYPIILAVGYKVGFSGLKLLWWAYGLGVLCLITTGYICFLLARRYNLPHYAASWLSLMVVSNGWILWGYFSGMEIALQATLLLLMLYFAVKETESGSLRWSPLWAGLLALTRPEGFLAAVVLIGWVLLQKFLYKRDIKYWFLIFLPIFLFFGQLLFYRLGTGQWGSNTFILKTWWYNLSPSGSLPPPFNKVLSLLIVIIHLLPRALILFANDIGLVFYIGVAVLLAALVRARKDEQKDAPLSLSVVWLIIFSIEFLALMNIYGVTEITRRRYFIFLAPLTIFFIVYLFWVSAINFFQATRYWQGIVFAFFTVLTIHGTLFFRQQYALDNENIWQMHFQLADWVQTHTNKETIIGMNDAGVIPYLTDRPILDLLGLVTNGMARVVHAGPEAFYNYLITLPPKQRPAYFAIFPGLFIADNLTPAHRSILQLFGRPLAHFSVSQRTIVPYNTTTVFKPYEY